MSYENEIAGESKFFRMHCQIREFTIRGASMNTSLKIEAIHRSLNALYSITRETLQSYGWNATIGIGPGIFLNMLIILSCLYCAILRLKLIAIILRTGKIHVSAQLALKWHRTLRFV